MTPPAVKPDKRIADAKADPALKGASEPAIRAYAGLPVTEAALIRRLVTGSGLNPRLHGWAIVEVLAELKAPDPARDRAVETKSPPAWLAARDATIARERIVDVVTAIRRHRASIREEAGAPRRHAGTWDPAR